MPFTSPALVGTRIRRGREMTPELLLPNPSGGLGFYILTWPNVRNLARPTVHDMQLYTLIAREAEITPAAMRQAFRDVAILGLAGRAVARAAAEAAARGRADAAATTAHILMRLVSQMEPPNARPPPPPEDTSPAAAQRREAAIAAAAGQLGQSPQRVQGALERLGELFSPSRGGHAPANQEQAEPATGQVMHLIAALEEILRSITHWPMLTNEVGSQIARELSSALQIAISCGRGIAADVDRHTENPLELLGMLFTRPDQIAQFAARPDWAMNGWEQVAVRWRHDCEDRQRTDMLKELLPLIPPLPKQAADWSHMRIDFDLLTPPANLPTLVEQAELASRTLAMTSRLEKLQIALLHPMGPHAAGPKVHPV